MNNNVGVIHVIFIYVSIYPISKCVFAEFRVPDFTFLDDYVIFN